MSIIKRIFLFGLTNIAVIAMLSIFMKLLGLDVAMEERGIPYFSLLIQAVILGFFGSFISLLLSKFMAKMSTGAKVINEPQNEVEAWLVSTVKRQAEAAGIGIPDVAIYPGSEMNAFATGASKDHALVAVSQGLLTNMRRNEVEAVLGHEIAHVANGDMVTMTLLQGVLNTFVIFISRIIGFFIDSAMRGKDERRGGGYGYYIAVFLLQPILGLFASIIVSWFSRKREFRADEGGATLTSPTAMKQALMRLASGAQTPLPGGLKAFGIGGGSMMALFSTHPPMEERIKALDAIIANGMAQH